MFDYRKGCRIFIAPIVMLTLAIASDYSLAVRAQGEKVVARSRYLLLDSRVIDNTTGVKPTLGKVKKHPANPLFGQDLPWEHHFDNFYGNIVYDEELKQFRLWYLNFIDGENSLLYAYSDDGFNWVKPNLGKFEYNGNTNNNIVMMGRHGVGVFKDLRETDPAKRFKMLAKHEAVGRWRDQYLEVAFSADGINWSDPIPQKQISATADTDNNAFWAPTLNKYVAMTRQWSRCPYNDQTKAPPHGSPEMDPGIDNRKGYRQVARTESTDFLNWARAELVLEGLNTRHQTHCLPVFYYAGVYIGMPGIWGTTGERQVHTELAWSPDTVDWHRINPGTSFIPNSDVKGDYDYGMVWRCVPPLFLDNDEVWLYYGGFDLRHGADGREGSLCLATMKKDRWAGYQAGSSAGTIETTLVKCAGKTLNICADVKDRGSIRAEVVGASGLSLSDSIPVTADVTDGVVTWPGKDLSALIGKRIKIRFELKNATLYSFGFDLKSRGKINSQLPETVLGSKEAMEKAVKKLTEKKRKVENIRRERQRAEIPALIEQMRHVDPDTRSGACNQLKNPAPLEVTVAPLIDALADDDMDVRDEASEALGNIAARIEDKALRKSAIDSLIGMLSDGEAEVREEAAEALGNIAAGINDKAELEAAVIPLTKARNDDEEGVREFAKKALREIGAK